MNIGQASKATSVSPKMIGLLPAAGRSGSGYRTYEKSDLHRLRFVRRSRDFGFSMQQIAALLALWGDRSRPSREVKDIALVHVAELDGKIRHLEELRDSLKHLADCCHGDNRPDCPILKDLDGSE